MRERHFCCSQERKRPSLDARHSTDSNFVEASSPFTRFVIGNDLVEKSQIQILVWERRICHSENKTTRTIIYDKKHSWQLLFVMRKHLGKNISHKMCVLVLYDFNCCRKSDPQALLYSQCELSWRNHYNFHRNPFSLALEGPTSQSNPSDRLLSAQ